MRNKIKTIFTLLVTVIGGKILWSISSLLRLTLDRKLKEKTYKTEEISIFITSYCSECENSFLLVTDTGLFQQLSMVQSKESTVVLFA